MSLTKSILKLLQNNWLHEIKWCLNCQKFIFHPSESIFYCHNCYNELPWFKADLCAICLRSHFLKDCPLAKTWKITSLNSVFNYAEPLNRLFLSFKFKGNAVAERMFNAFLTAYIHTNSYLFKNIDLILNVPSTKKGIFNQLPAPSSLLLDCFPKSLSYPAGIVSIKKTKPQIALNKKERELNMSRANLFKLNIEVADKSVLLFDDVCTTGATMRNLAKLLRRQGALEVHCLSLFREH